MAVRCPKHFSQHKKGKNVDENLFLKGIRYSFAIPILKYVINKDEQNHDLGYAVCDLWILCGNPFFMPVE